jgi:hypothetical protein
MVQELISKKLRTEFCEHLVGWTLRTIRNEFDSADITCDENYQPGVSGERRTLVLQYYHTLDCTKPADVKKLLVAFENILNVETERIQSMEISDPRGELDTIRSAVEKLCKLLHVNNARKPWRGGGLRNGRKTWRS